MLASDNSLFTAGAPAAADFSLADLLDAAAAHRDRRLVFLCEGRPLKPGYHVTEVKAGAFNALDCGGDPESWSEVFVQLWDVDDGTPMTAGKFAAIIGKVGSQVALDRAARLTFEVSDGRAPMQLYRAGAAEASGDALHVTLAPRPASCKPRDRWSGAEADRACCGPAPAGAPCCGGT